MTVHEKKKYNKQRSTSRSPQNLFISLPPVPSLVVQRKLSRLVLAPVLTSADRVSFGFPYRAAAHIVIDPETCQPID